jgi:hypothetical protein
MPTPAEVWQGRQRQVSAATASAVLRVWEQVRLDRPQRTFERALPQLLAAVTAGQLAAASGAPEYVATSVSMDGRTADPVATVPARRFAGLASDGRPLIGLLTQPLLRTLYLRTRGADDAAALSGGRLSLETVVRTEVLDTGRDAVSVAAGLDRSVTGYVRQVSLPACGRCVLLAGKFFRRNAGFDRHPRCDCQHVPTGRVVQPGEVDQDPRTLFNGMTREQQDRAFGKDNAEVIRRGGDIGQVVNARRGMATAGSNWTTEGTTSRGAFGRSQGATRGRFSQQQRVRASSQREQAGKRLAGPRPSPGALLRFANDPDEFALALERAGYL